MTPEEKAKIIQGFVLLQNRWVPMGKKVDYINSRRTKIEKGLVEFNGEWVTIEEKFNSLAPKAAPAPVQQQPQNVTIHKTVNRQVYNVNNNTDNRTVHNTHEHKHVHVDPAMLGAGEDGSEFLGSPGNRQQLGASPKRGQLPGRKQGKLPPGQKPKLLPPEDVEVD